MKIVYIGKGYPERRMIIKKINNSNYQYKRISRANDPFFLFVRMLEVLCHSSKIKEIRERLSYNFSPLFFNADIVHVFNTVCKCKGKWISTFEANFPSDVGAKADDYINYVKRTATLIIKDNCIGILAMSKWAYLHTLMNWENIMTLEEYNFCKRKLIIMEPPQNVLIKNDELRSKFNNNTFEFLFVGREFQRKGGENLIRVLKKFEGKFKFHLTIISDFSLTKYSTFPNDVDKNEQYKRYVEYANWITYYENLSNEEVLKIMKKADVGFLPTYLDTYGFSVLEMQASGCPVVTTNINALKDINSDDRGWIIDLDKYNDSVGLDYSKCKEEISEIIDTQLYKILQELFNTNSQILYEKALNSIRYIKEFHSPQNYCKKMKGIYEKS